MFIQCSGVWLLGTSTYLYSSTSVNNVGTYFYNQNQIVGYTCGTTTATETSKANITSGLSGSSPNEQFLSNVVFTRNSPDKVLTYTTGTFRTSLQTSAIAYSPTNVGSESINSNLIPVIIDPVTYSLITNISTYPTTIPNLGGITAIGFRINSSAPTTIGSSVLVSPVNEVNNTLYDNTTSLTTNLYDLQIFNGAYGTKGSSGSQGYLNYTGYIGNTGGIQAGADYTGLTGVSAGSMTTSTYRFASYTWNCTTSNTYTKIEIKINGIVGTVTNPNTIPYIGSTADKIYIYYRIQNSSDGSSFGPSFINSAWTEINNNTVNISLTSGNYYESTLILGGKDASINNTFNSSTYTMYGIINQLTEFGTNVRVYVRIAFPFDSNFKFTNVTARLYQ
jgi:hypothetical protein